MSWEVSSEVAARRSRSQEDGQDEAATHSPRTAAKPSSRGGKEVTLAGLLRKKAVAAPAPAPTPERDELEEYLSAPLETDTNLDLLAYWKLKKGIDVAQARQE